MAHFAEINDNNIVVQVIVINNNQLLDTNNNEQEIKGIDFCESLYGHRNWVQTSYNGSFRYNFAGQGYIWDNENNAFYEPQPYASWKLDENYEWQPPIPYPNNTTIVYEWDEENINWIEKDPYEIIEPS